MNDKDFDKRIKELADSYQEPFEDDVWTGIQEGISKRKRITLFRRVGYAAAAAACLTMGIFIFSPDDNPASMQIAVVSVKGPAAPQIDSPKIAKLSKLTAMPRKASVSPAYEVAVSTSSASEVSVLEEQKAGAAESIAAAESTPERTADTSPLIDQLPEIDYFADFEEPVKGKSRKPLLLGVTANIMAANPGSSDFSSPKYAPGMGSSSNYGIVPTTEPKFFFPVSAGLQLQIPIVKNFSIGVGVNYTLLHSEYQALIDNSAQGMVNQNLHYLGIPVSLYFNIIQSDVLKFYVSGGGMIEKGLQSKCSIVDLFDETSVRKESVSGVQWSANLGLGFEYRFADFVGVYLDPSLSYFFNCGQPFSVRTSQPLQFKMEIGFRFHL